MVYLGTAGTGRQGGGHLFQRLNWHITQAHTPPVICNEALSTLRTGIGSLVSNDLILCPPTTTQDEVNRVFETYFKVYCIVYANGNEAQIDADEKILIQKIKPLFNIKNNPNALIPGTSTFIYTQRRRLITSATKMRLGC